MRYLSLSLVLTLVLACGSEKKKYKKYDKQILDEWTEVYFDDEFGDPNIFWGYNFRTKDLTSNSTVQLDLSKMGIVTSFLGEDNEPIPLNFTSNNFDENVPVVARTVEDYVVFRMKMPDDSIKEFRSSRIEMQNGIPISIICLEDTELYTLITNEKEELIKVSIVSENGVGLVSFWLKTMRPDFDSSN